MKRLFLIIAFLFIPELIYAAHDVSIDLKSIPLAKEYSQYEDFDVDKISEKVFYKLNTNCKYYISNSNNAFYIIDDKQGGLMFVYNETSVDLGIDDIVGTDDIHTSDDSSLYLVRSNKNYYIFVDKMYYNDSKYYRLYQFKNNKIELVEENSGRIDFVGHDYIIGYTDLGIIGYQKCEFKKVFKNGKLELDGEYKVVEQKGDFPFWHYYTLVKDLEYEEFDDNTMKYKKKVLKAGVKIRALSTDAKTYIEIETEDKKCGHIKIDSYEIDLGEFKVNNQSFMDYYFLDGTKYPFEVFKTVSVCY